MEEMTFEEAAKVLETDVYEEMPCHATNQPEIEAIELAASILRRVASGELAEVVHAHWIFGSTQGHSWMKCSRCLVSQSGQTATFTFCPNCGALMDGKDDSHETD